MIFFIISRIMYNSISLIKIPISIIDTPFTESVGTAAAAPMLPAVISYGTISISYKKPYYNKFFCKILKVVRFVRFFCVIIQNGKSIKRLREMSAIGAKILSSARASFPDRVSTRAGLLLCNGLLLTTSPRIRTRAIIEKTRSAAE